MPQNGYRRTTEGLEVVDKKQACRLGFFSMEKMWLKGYDRGLQNHVCNGGEKQIGSRCLVCSDAKIRDIKERYEVWSEQKLVVSHVKCH